ncbi:MAG TPA: type IV toxin-antitoxin system AbiEi family antitoxin domain-containing protein [Actinophytocola sp.]|uniref:type IV toxin-antitoxin system AbiEi family antitoxin domain-containing protein n=1 Tax=Actinophytocola sp. TaxID=1872138 RepID=UPI002DF9A60A|nr:type IV toxin-antitoxin system AbiEi family antitoxin domain-containing protein [Actinophytocola sp.]
MTIEGVLRRQAGVVSRAQALTEGMSSATISRRLARGLWVRLLPRVYLAAGHALTAEARLRASYLWAGLGATVCGAAAAWWHGLCAEAPTWVEITIPHHRRLPAQPGIQAHRRDLQSADRVEVNGLWVTAVPLTVLDAAVALGTTGSHLMDRALQHRFTVTDLYAAHYRNLGRRGSADAAELLRAASDRAASGGGAAAGRVAG